ncbi:hypothetical protein DQQ10_05955 [Pseudochryseolinea flava]|uniref:Uncharacterized protein n=1 Tax=Pseudochryseolinea flava TaxID=2059302 RepID=A0A364Y7I1_9BACT|nr:hypothetical protein DQQ10_05955 [Pseudochryseolinea flava]
MQHSKNYLSPANAAHNAVLLICENRRGKRLARTIGKILTLSVHPIGSRVGRILGTDPVTNT